MPREPRRANAGVVHVRRPGGGLDLLRQIVAESVDPGYAEAAKQPRRRRWPIRFAVIAVIIGALVTISVVQTSRSAPQLADERRELIDRVIAADAETERLREQTVRTNTEIEQLRSPVLGDDTEATRLEQRIGEAELVTGAKPVRGPGLVAVVDDAPRDSGDVRDRVLDLDLQILVNGMWQVGAEAIAINGHRLSTLTAIRSAGQAITVDYRSLRPPYRVEAIVDPRTAQARLVQTRGGLWWNELTKERGMRYELSTVEEINMEADPGLGLRSAERSRR